MHKRIVLLALVFVTIASMSMGYETYSWNPNVIYQRYSCNQDAYPYITPSQGVDRLDPENYSLPRNIFYCCNEDYYTANPFIGFTYGWAVFPCAWTWNQFGAWTIQKGLNKYDYDIYRNQFTFVGFNDTFSTWPNDMRPPLNLDIRCYFRMRNISGAVGYDSRDDGYGHAIGWGQSRAMLGALAYWNNREHFLEINMWSTDGYDQITTTWNRWASPPGQTWRDVTGNLYLRRSYYGSGECVFYHSQNMNLLSGFATSIPALTTTMQAYDINIAQVFRATPWSDPPGSWSNIKIEGTYLGVECWGKAKYIIEHDLFNTFRY